MIHSGCLSCRYSTWVKGNVRDLTRTSMKPYNLPRSVKIIPLNFVFEINYWNPSRRWLHFIKRTRPWLPNACRNFICDRIRRLAFRSFTWLRLNWKLEALGPGEKHSEKHHKFYLTMMYWGFGNQSRGRQLERASDFTNSLNPAPQRIQRRIPIWA